MSLVVSRSSFFQISLNPTHKIYANRFFSYIFHRAYFTNFAGLMLMSFRIAFVNSTSIIDVTHLFCGSINLLIVEMVFELTFHCHIYFSNIGDMFHIFVLNKWILELPIWHFYCFGHFWFGMNVFNVSDIIHAFPPNKHSSVMEYHGMFPDRYNHSTTEPSGKLLATMHCCRYSRNGE